MIDFRIDTFLCVCKYMSFTKAAEALNITQPAVSQHIRYLEDLYKTKLFTHEGKKIMLSSSGSLLLQTATTVKNDEALMIDQMHQEVPEQLPLIFGVTMTIGEFAIAKPLAKYIKKYPDKNVKMIMENTQMLIKGLKSGEIHFALVEGQFPESEFESVVYSTEQFIPVCSAYHIFHQPPRIVKDLLMENLLIREDGSGTRDILEKSLNTRNITIDQFGQLIEISNMNTIVHLLLSDCGISFLYKPAVSNELANGQLMEIPMEDFKMFHDFTFIWNKGSAFSKEYLKICEELTSIDR